MSLDRVRQTCAASLPFSGIKVNTDGIQNFWRTIDMDYFAKFSEEHGVTLPLTFNSDVEELNVLAILSLLNYLHGYRVFLHQATGRGAYDTIRYFMMAAFLDADAGPSPLSAQGMATLSEAKTAELLGLPLMSEKAHESLPGVTVGQRIPEAVEIVHLVRSVLNETGAILVKQGYATLGNFVVETLEHAASQTPDQRAEILVQALVETFPGFNDVGTVKGHQVCLYKKALFCIQAIASTFNAPTRPSAPTFPLPSNKHIPVFCDNILCMMSIYYKLTDVSDTSFEKLKSIDTSKTSATRVEAARLDKEEAYALRAATVAACEAAIHEARAVSEELKKRDDGGDAQKRADWLAAVEAVQLDGFLWSVAKDGKLRDIPRIAERGTIYY